MKSSELKKGELYYAEFSYGQYQVEVLDTALFTDRTVRDYEEVTKLVDPPTPFDPQTGAPNPKVERTEKQSIYKTVREPGYKPRSSSFYRGGAQAGVPCKAVSAYRALNPEKYPDDTVTEILVRPQDIKYSWATHVESLKRRIAAEDKAKADREAFAKRVSLMKQQLPSLDIERSHGSYARSTTRVTVNLTELEVLLASLGEEDEALYDPPEAIEAMAKFAAEQE
jgi:hypothetical protein